MTAKQLSGTYSPDGSRYGCVTTGSGTLVEPMTTTPGTAKQTVGVQAPDGSIYFTLTNGSGTLA